MEANKQGQYEFNICTVKKLGENTIKICETACTHIKGMESGTLEDDARMFLLQTSKKPNNENTEKLSNNIVRAKTKVKELVLCNEWDFWCTFTISPDKQNRYDLETFVKRFGNFIHDYNRRCDEADKVKYLLVPEQHKDGAWHMHGFIKGIRPKDLYRNKHKHLCWRQYEEKFGFISMEPLKDKDRASSYVLKYLTKDLSRNVSELGAHLYYSSKNLNKPQVIYRGHAELHDEWDFVHPDGFCKIKTIDTRKTELSEILEITP